MQRRTTAAALALAVAIGVFFASPFLGTAWRHGLDWPIRLEGEAPTLTTYGRWWIRPPHRYLTDGFSGEFPTYYNYVSDAILNVLSAPFAWPTMTVQAVVYGPLLASLLFLGVFATARALGQEGKTALLAALLLSLGVSSGLPRLLPGFDANVLESLLHTPFHAVSLGTAQSLGWVLFLPTLGLFYLAFERFTPSRALGFGALTGLLAHVHTLTFLNAGLVQVAWLAVRCFEEAPDRPKRSFWRAATLLVVLGFAARALLGPPLSVRVLAVPSAALLALAFLADPDRRPYLWGYGAAALVVAPYLLALLREPAGLAGIAEASNAQNVGGVPLLAFYATYLAAAGFAIARSPERRILLFLVTVFATTLVLAFNHLWNWGNHPYRFAIHLLFPLALLAAEGLRHAPARARLALGAWFAVAMLDSVAAFVTGMRYYVAERPVVEETVHYLRRVREVTAAVPPDHRLLNAAEFHYPIGLGQNTLVFNYSARPGFLPDYRYLLVRERYFNRLAFFCFLFPGYPAFDYHLGRRACAEELDPPAELLVLREPRLRGALLPAYRIAFAVANGKPLAGHVSLAQDAYGWPTVTGASGRRLARTTPPEVPGLARFLAAEREGRTYPFETDEGGPHLIAIAGRRLAERVPRVHVDGQEVHGKRQGNWALLRAALGPGPHRLELETAGVDRDGERDLLYFAAVVAASRAEACFTLPAETAGGNEAQPSAVSSAGKLR